MSPRAYPIAEELGSDRLDYGHSVGGSEIERASQTTVLDFIHDTFGWKQTGARIKERYVFVGEWGLLLRVRDRQELIR